MVLATVSTIDGYGFSFNYVRRQNNTDTLYYFLLSIMWYVIYIYIYIYTDRLI